MNPAGPVGHFNVRHYGALGNGTTDDTLAIQSAINAAVTAGGGTVYLPYGAYLVSLQANQQTGYNAILQLPFVSGSGAPGCIPLTLEGDGSVAVYPEGTSSPAFSPQSTTILVTSIGSGTNPSIIGGPNGTASQPTVVLPICRGITVMQPNPGTWTAFDFNQCVGARVYECSALSGTENTAGNEATAITAGAGFVLPHDNAAGFNNYGGHVIRDSYVSNLGIGFRMTGHASCDQLFAQGCYSGMSFIESNHGIHIGRYLSQNCKNALDCSLAGPAFPQTVIEMLDYETTSGQYTMNDPHQWFTGEIHYWGIAAPTFNGSPNPSIGNNVKWRCIISSDTGAALPASPLVSGTVYQNVTGAPMYVQIPAWATTPGTPGTVIAGMDRNSSATYFETTHGVAGSTSPSEPQQVQFFVPNLWFYQVILSGVTIGNGSGMAI